MFVVTRKLEASSASSASRGETITFEWDVASKASNASNAQWNLDGSKPFVSIKKACKQVVCASKSKDLTLDISKVPSKYKCVLLGYVSKALYVFDKYRGKQKLTPIKVYDKANGTMVRNFVKQINMANIARDLENEPANMMSPQAFCDRVEAIFHGDSHVKVRIKDEKEMAKEGLNLVLAVGLSSKRMPRFMTIEYIVDKALPTICLVGKTVVYDAGGLNIKMQSMTPEMKTDKSGGCVVVAAIKYFTKYFTGTTSKPKFNLVGILPVVENVLSEDVTRPGDIITSYKGNSVEVTDTDAEGRLIMADAIAYSKKYKPSYIMDIATLTGWAETVHMDLAAVCYSKNVSLVDKITKVGDKVGERVWFLPVWDEYMEYIKSNVANVKNHNPNVASGAYYPSMFLLSFVPLELRDKYVHFDICNNFDKNLARGNCVSLLIETIKSI